MTKKTLNLSKLILFLPFGIVVFNNSVDLLNLVVALKTMVWFCFSIKRPKLHHHAKVPLVAPGGDQVVFSDEEELIHVSPPPVRKHDT